MHIIFRGKKENDLEKPKLVETVSNPMVTTIRNVCMLVPCYTFSVLLA